MKVMLPLCDLLMLEARVVDWYLKTKVLYMIVTAHAIVMIREDTGSSISSHYSNHHKSEFGRSTWRLTQLSLMFLKFPFFFYPDIWSGRHSERGMEDKHGGS